MSIIPKGLWPRERERVCRNSSHHPPPKVIIECKSHCYWINLWNGAVQELRSGEQAQVWCHFVATDFPTLGEQAYRGVFPTGVGYASLPGSCSWGDFLLHSRWHSSDKLPRASLGAWTWCPGLALLQTPALSSEVLGALSNDFSSERDPNWCQTEKSSSHSSQSWRSGFSGEEPSARPSRTWSQNVWTSLPSSSQKTQIPSTAGCLGGDARGDGTPQQWAWWQWSSGTWRPA